MILLHQYEQDCNPVTQLPHQGIGDHQQTTIYIKFSSRKLARVYRNMCSGILNPDTNLRGIITPKKGCSMEKQRRTFTTQFKLETASLIVDQKYSYREACRALDVGESALQRWVLNYERSVKVKRHHT